MKALTRFEAFLEGLVEGSFRRLFRGRIEPVDLARRLGRVMDDRKRVTWDRPLVPNQYRITLAMDDYAEMQSFRESLQRELEKFVAERADERGYGMLGAAGVSIVPEAALAAGTFNVTASLIDERGTRGADEEPVLPPDGTDFGQTRAMRPLEMPLGPTGYETIYLVGVVGGKRVTWPVSGARVTVGRGLDNDVHLDDASVSRHHAEIARESGRLEVRDLSSTNGTWVNARRVAASPVQVGDQLAFGAVHLEVARRVPE
jgi:hypothetical protein